MSAEQEGRLVRFGIILAVVLAAYWIGLSGYFTGMLLTLGVISILLVIGLCARMKILDIETVPYKNLGSTMLYFWWLFAEIVKANVEVVSAVLSPSMKISPTLVKIPATQKSVLGWTMFVTSISLRPGTVRMEMGQDEILVHALLSDMADPNGFAEMGERSAQAVGEKGGASA